MTSDTQPAPYKPHLATPVGAAAPAFGNPETAPASPKPRKKPATKRKAKKAARKRVLTKKDTKAILGRGGARRVAALSVDFAQAMQMAAGLKKKDVAAIQAVVQLLNPLARPARKRVMEAVAGVLS